MKWFLIYFPHAIPNFDFFSSEEHKIEDILKNVDYQVYCHRLPLYDQNKYLSNIHNDMRVSKLLGAQSLLRNVFNYTLLSSEFGGSFSVSHVQHNVSIPSFLTEMILSIY